MPTAGGETELLRRAVPTRCEMPGGRGQEQTLPRGRVAPWETPVVMESQGMGACGFRRMCHTLGGSAPQRRLPRLRPGGRVSKSKGPQRWFLPGAQRTSAACLPVLVPDHAGDACLAGHHSSSCLPKCFSFCLVSSLLHKDTGRYVKGHLIELGTSASTQTGSCPPKTHIHAAVSPRTSRAQSADTGTCSFQVTLPVASDNSSQNKLWGHIRRLMACVGLEGSDSPWQHP